jgi:hypothetical protein
MTTEDVKKRLDEIRKSIDLQLALSNGEGLICVDQSEAEMIVMLIDTVIRWDYDIR